MSSGFWIKAPGEPPPGKGVYIVQRLSWRLWGDETGPHARREEGDQGTPLRCFRSRELAEACCRELEQQARREMTPFQFGEEPEQLTSLKERAFCKALRRLGLTPPTLVTFPTAYKTIDWRAWWDAVAADLSEAQRDGVYDLLDELRFYEVVQAELSAEEAAIED